MTDYEFVEIWNLSKGVTDAATRINTTVILASARASRCRKRGLPAKRFPAGGKARPEMHTMQLCKVCEISFRVFPYEVKSGKGTTCSTKCKAIYLKGRYGTHKLSRSRLYSIWCGMKRRCKPACKFSTKYYSGRGISVCKEWQESFEAFRDWALANGYVATLEIDRKDNGGNYEPGNCRWATRHQQMYNTRGRSWASSRFKGVSKRRNKWVAQLTKHGKNTQIGLFINEEDAARAYDKAAIMAFGEYANLNFKEEGVSS